MAAKRGATGQLHEDRQPAKRHKKTPSGLLADRTASPATVTVLSAVAAGHPSTAARAVQGALSRDEATTLVDWAAGQGFAFGWGSDDPHAARRKDYRSANTVEVDDAALAARLWQRLRDALPATVHVNECGDPSSVGEWRAVGLHPRLLFVEYRDGGHFSPHADGFLVAGPHERSLCTVLMYLNDVESGGETQLLEPLDSQQQAEQQQQTQKPRHEQEQGKEEGQQVAEEAQQHDGGGDAGEGAPLLQQDERGRFRPHPDQIRCVHSQSPRCGSALIFFQTALHEGVPVAPGSVKYMLRADALFRRVRHPTSVSPPRGAAGAEEVDSHAEARDSAAFALLQQAEAIESVRVNAPPAADDTKTKTALPPAPVVKSSPRALREAAFEKSPAVAALFGGSVEAAARAAALWRTR